MARRGWICPLGEDVEEQLLRQWLTERRKELHEIEKNGGPASNDDKYSQAAIARQLGISKHRFYQWEKPHKRGYHSIYHWKKWTKLLQGEFIFGLTFKSPIRLWDEG